MMPKRALFLIDSMDGGGAERIMSYLLNRLDRRRYRPSLGLLLRRDVGYPLSSDIPVHLLCDDELSPVGSCLLLFLAIFIAPLSLFGGRDFRKSYDYFRDVLRQLVGGCLALRRHILENRPEVIVVFLQTSVVITLFTLRMMRSDIPVICSDRILLSQELHSRRFPRLNRALMRWLYHKADGYVAVSDQANKDMVENFGLSPQRVSTIYNGLDLEDLAERSQRMVEDDADIFIAERVHFVSVGRLTQQKGFDLLIKAFAIVHRSVDCRLVIIGTGDQQSDLEAVARQLGTEEDVVFAGWKPNPFPYLSAADVFVMSSRYEGFPNSLMEAMALGLPVVSTDCPSGPSELLSKGRYGFLVPNESEKELAEAMLRLASDASLRQVFGRRARKRIQEFSLDRMVTAFDAALSRYARVELE